MKKFLGLFIFAGIVYCSCQKVNYYPDQPVDFTHTIVLSLGNDTFRNNSYECCINSFPITDGVEVDVQMSKDRTVWLSHPSDVIDCGNTVGCFPETKDQDIEKIITCNGKNARYTKLEEVMSYMDKNNIRKWISIDIKGWLPCSGNSVDISGEMETEVTSILELGEKYHLTQYLIFETETISVLDWIKKQNTVVKTYITSYGDYEKGMLQALEHHFDGISYKAHFKDEIDAEKMALLHKKGLKLMAWNIPDSAYINYLKSVNVDIIQINL